jgi:hypothetical protein
VAEGTIIGFDMSLVTERYRPGLFYFNSFIRHFVTADTLLQIEGTFAVVACATRLPLVHIRHAIALFLPEVVYRVMAGLTVILNPLLPKMIIMAEYYLAKTINANGHILDVNRIDNRAGQYDQDEKEKRAPLFHVCLLQIKKEQNLMSAMPSLNKGRRKRSSVLQISRHYIKEWLILVNSYCRGGATPWGYVLITKNNKGNPLLNRHHSSSISGMKKKLRISLLMVSFHLFPSCPHLSEVG